jgi:hypothetical protein
MSPSKSKTAVAHANDHPIHKMIATQHHKNNILSQQELKEVRTMSRKLRKLKRQLFLKQVEAPDAPVDIFRSFIVGLAVKEEALEAKRERSRHSPRGASSFDDTRNLGRNQE